MMKKLKLNPIIKWSCALVLCGIGAWIGINSYKASGKVETVTTEKTRYNYNIDTEARYAVNIIPNEVFDTDKMPEGELYFPKLIRSINTFFATSITSSESVEMKGHYEINLQLASYITQDEVKKDLWTKNYILSPRKSFNYTGEGYQLERFAEVDYPTYKAILEQLAEIVGANGTTEMRVRYQGEVELITPHGTFQKPLDASIIIPIGGSYFTITKEGGGTIADEVKDTETMTLPVANTTLVRDIIGIVVCLLGAVALLVFTTAPTAEDKRKKKITAMFQQHGSRMVGVDHVDLTSYKIQYSVNSLDDLVKIADELERPVLYCNNRDKYQIINFYTLDKDVAYIYTIEESVTVAAPIEWKLEA